MFWKNLMVGQNLMVGHALLGGWKWSELPCSVIWHLLVIILMHWVFQFWLWGRFVAEKQTWVLILMSGHRPEMTYYENGEKKVCELDHYTDQSYLGIHYWDLVSKVAYPKLKKNWNSNVQTWETVKIWGDVLSCNKVPPYIFQFKYMLLRWKESKITNFIELEILEFWCPKRTHNTKSTRMPLMYHLN